MRLDCYDYDYYVDDSETALLDLLENAKYFSIFQSFSELVASFISVLAQFGVLVIDGL